MTSGIAPAFGIFKGTRADEPRAEAPYIGISRAFRNLKGRPGRWPTESISITPRRRRSCPRRRRRSAAACEAWANPSSAHAEGRAVRAAMEGARRRIAAALGWDGTLIFTSGATEAIDIVMRAGQGRAAHRLGDRASGGAAQRPGRAADRGEGRRHARPRRSRRGAGRGRAAAGRGPVGQQRDRRDPSDRRRSPARVAAAGGLLLVDCAQSAGKLPLPEADFIIIAAHKLGGPPGIGALLVRDTRDAGGGRRAGGRLSAPAPPRCR